jgi:hypothetical protein
MSKHPLDKSKPLIAPSEATGAMPGPTRSSARRAQERRRALIIIIGCGMLLVAIPAAAVMIVAKSPPLSNPAPATIAMPDSDVRVARITKDLDGKGCSQQTFDNQTGRMVRSARPCDATTYDSNGAPVPVGTIHRLDAISKSFVAH